MVPISRRLSETIRQIAERLDPVEDAELLRRVRENRDESAFAAVLERHGPMVMALCRRLLGRDSQAEDVFQATFLTLFRRIREIRQPEYLSSWLYRVAWNIGTRVRAKKFPAVQEAIDREAADPFARTEWAELRGVLDEELNRLPERVRAAMVVCYLEGLPREQAAARLKVSRRTLMRLLEEGRSTLRQRLDRRGLAAVPLALTVLEGSSLAGAVAPELLERVIAQLHGAAVPEAVAQLLPTASWLGGLKTVLMATALALGCGGFLLSTETPVPKEVPAKEGPAKEGSPVAKVTDVDGPLPEGALRRFGTKAYRIGDSFWFGNCSADGSRMVSRHIGHSGGMLWDLRDGNRKQIAALRDNHVPQPTISPNGKWVANLDGGLGVRLIDAESGKEVRWLEPELQVTDLQFRDDSRQLFCLAALPRVPPVNPPEGTKILVLDLETGKRLHEHDAPTGIQWRTQVNGKNYLLGLLRSDQKSRLVLTDPTTGGRVGEYVVPGLRALGRTWSGQVIQPWAVDPDLKLAAYLDRGYNVVLWNLGDAKVVHTFKIPATKNRFRDGPATFGLGFGDDSREYDPVALHFSPNGKHLVVMDSSEELHRLDLESLKLATLMPVSQGNSAVIFAIAGAGQTIIVAGERGIVRRDLMTGKILSGGDGYRRDLHAGQSRDGKWLVLCEMFGKIDILELATGERVRRYDLEELHRTARSTNDSGRLPDRFQGNHFAFAPDGKILALAHGHTIILWDLTARRERTGADDRHLRIAHDLRGISSMCFSPDGRLLLAALSSGQTRVFDAGSGKRLWEQGEYKTSATWDDWVGFSPDGRSIIRGHRVQNDGKVWLSLLRQNALTGTDLGEHVFFQLPSDKSVGVAATCLSPDGRLIAVLLSDGRLKLFDSLTLREAATWENASKNLVTRGFALGWGATIFADQRGLAFSPNGQTIAVVDQKGLLHLHETFSGKEVFTRATPLNSPNSVQFSGDGNRILTASADGLAYVWDGRIAGSLAESWWDDLKGDDPRKAYRAVCALIREKGAVEKLRTAVAALPADELPDIAGAIEDLNDPRFTVRERASKLLKNIGKPAENALLRALEAKSSEDLRRRIEEVLAERRLIPTADEMRLLRAISVLEGIGDADAKRLLEQWAASKRLGWLASEADGARKRMGE
jgi:RNA polymerase sigma factor (sigma-70 family)